MLKIDPFYLYEKNQIINLYILYKINKLIISVLTIQKIALIIIISDHSETVDRVSEIFKLRR